VSISKTNDGHGMASKDTQAAEQRVGRVHEIQVCYEYTWHQQDDFGNSKKKKRLCVILIRVHKLLYKFEVVELHD
jgi:hypothetical protein